ncbi:molybdopterin-dependent oxidoreductase [Arenibaculum sp.]|uniref:molybdopterin-containing oxidoreductase family protein n=1 Tax=Arenibaculum sp. TaxID=2865862 RepID=UPI002E156EC8|nr:molybdopterin-dependent oxidoreductase [Arenibaculum sp.]
MTAALRTEPRTVRTVCGHDCPDGCSINVTVSDGRILRVEGDPDHSFTAGFVCAKVAREGDLVQSPERLTTPLRRTGAKGAGAFEPMDWDEALEEITTRWREIRSRWGSTALMGYAYGGHQGKVNRNLLNGVFAALGSTHVDSATVCDSCANLAWEAVAGDMPGTDPETARDADLVIAWSSDLVTTNVHFWRIVQEARRRGARLVVVDPRRNRTAQQADWHLGIPVGTDAALALGVMHVLVRDGRCDRAWLERNAHGFDRLEAETLPRFSPAAVEASAGIPAADIERLASLIADAKAPFIRIGTGMSRTRHGGSAVRAVALLPGVVGAYGRPGAGAMMAMSPRSGLDLGALRNPTGAPPPRSVPLARLGRVLLEMDDPPIKALFIAANNPAVTCPDSGRVRKGLEREDLFTVVHGPFLTDTARYADIVLPSTTFLETEDIYAGYGASYAQYGTAVVPPVGQSRSNARLAVELARRMGLDQAPFSLDHAELVDLVIRDVAVDHAALLAGGPVRLPRPQPGPEFGTPTGKLEFHSELLAAQGLPALPDWQPDAPADGRYPLRLLTAPGHFLSHTSYSGVAFLRGREREPAVVLHPEEAARRGLADGELVEAHNDLGRIVHRLRVSDEVQPGIALVVGQRPRGEAVAGTVNDLCDDTLSDIGDGATYQDTRLEVRRAPA